MNRKQRRANNKTHATGPASAGQLFAAAVQYHRDGRLAEAEQLYRRILATEPRHSDSLHRLGIIAHQQGHHAQAGEYLRKAIAQNPGVAAYHAHLGLALGAQGRLDEAVASCRSALALEPNLPDIHNNLGVMLVRSGKPQEAVACYGKAIALEPRLPEAHNNLGNALLELGRPQEAAVCYRNVLALMPDFAEAHANLGSVLMSIGQLADAVECFGRASQIDPRQADILNNLAVALMALGDPVAAMDAITRSLSLGESPENKRTFVYCVKHMRFGKASAALRPLLLRALREGWDRPDDLAQVSADLVKQRCDVLVRRANARGKISEVEIFGENGFAALADDSLLQALLSRTPNPDIELERLLVAARRMLLRAAVNQDVSGGETASNLAFCSALAHQCFINEYVFHRDEDELRQAQELRDLFVAALEDGTVVRPDWIVAVAAYFPLFSVPLSHRLLDASWPPAIEAVLTQQIREPEEEGRLRASIPRLTRIEDPVSHSVQAQYEENPYPRWVEAGAAGVPQDLTIYLRQKFPFASVENSGSRVGVEILVAGCGTGRNAIETTQKFKGARTLAVDLSLNSLAYAARKSRGPIEYAQADLLELGSMERRFDLIEAVGVLHHMADPFAGWHVLSSLLRPGGIMMIGLYSAAARRNLPDMRGWTTASGASADEIREVRQQLMGSDVQPDVVLHPDFFTISTCRDLLFHVRERHVSLAAIGEFLNRNNLKFVGFSIDDAVLAAYRQRFPDDPGVADLEHWQEFEDDNPDTFSGMYQFWLQKAL